MKAFYAIILALHINLINSLRIKLKSTNCEINTHIKAVDNIMSDKYDLLLSLSTDGECSISCYMNDNPSIAVRSTDSYQFYGRFYYFFTIPNLTTFEKYSYSCGENKSLSMQSFPIQFPKTKNTKVLTFGDWSKHMTGLNTYDLLSKLIPNVDYDALVTLGDYSYNMGASNDPSWDMGNLFFKWITPLTSQIPFMMNAGNHEYSDKDFLQYIKRFLMPNKKNSDNLYYSFDINDVHFVSVTSEFGLVNYKGHVQYTEFKDWFENDLNNSNKKWKIVYMHRPLYCSWTERNRCSHEAKELREFFEDMFYQNRIDLVLAGHLHNYERMFPVYNGNVDVSSISADKNTYTNPKYPVHLICGTGGNREGVTPKYQLENFSQQMSSSSGVCELDFDNDNLNIKFINTDGNFEDSFRIVKSQ